jgi:hypothetical protein
VTGVGRVIVALGATTAVFLAWVVVFPVVVMALVLYIVRIVPLTGRRRRHGRKRGGPGMPT